MIVEHRWEKRCNICKDLLAIKKHLFFRTVRPYVPVNMEIDGLMGNDTLEMHVCQECWVKLKDIVRRETAEDGK